jgi:hypothetical protein
MSRVKEDGTPVLCYVSAPWAYFTTQPLADQWGDDWNDAPYEHNAGEPYWPHGKDEGKWEIIKVAWDGPFDAPIDHAGLYSRWSVETINSGAVPWLSNVTNWAFNKKVTPPVSIFAGTPLNEFKRLVRNGGGKFYVEDKR